MRERFFLAYDFTEDKRRAKLVKILEKFGVRIQYSLFEFLLTPARKIEFFAKLNQQHFLDGQDGENVLIIPIGEADVVKVRRFGSATVNVFDEGMVLV